MHRVIHIRAGHLKAMAAKAEEVLMHVFLRRFFVSLGGAKFCIQQQEVAFLSVREINGEIYSESAVVPDFVWEPGSPSSELTFLVESFVEEKLI